MKTVIIWATNEERRYLAAATAFATKRFPADRRIIRTPRGFTIRDYEPADVVIVHPLRKHVVDVYRKKAKGCEIIQFDGTVVVGDAFKAPSSSNLPIIPQLQPGTPSTPGFADGDTETGPDLRTHSLNSEAAKTLISQLDNVDEINLLRAGELSHPKYEGGRPGVLKAIDARFAELTQ